MEIRIPLNEIRENLHAQSRSRLIGAIESVPLRRNLRYLLVTAHNLFPCHRLSFPSAPTHQFGQ